MNAREAIKLSMNLPTTIVQMYLGDLNDGDLFVRPTAGANHIAWQLGHLIAAEHVLIDAVCPGIMPPLPAGFAEKHSKETATNDNPADFLTKAEYLALAAEQRAGTLKALDSISDDDLDKPGAEKFKHLCPTVAAAFMLQPSHWTMHAGQWAVIRRQLGRPPLF